LDIEVSVNSIYFSETPFIREESTALEESRGVTRDAVKHTITGCPKEAILWPHQASQPSLKPLLENDVSERGGYIKTRCSAFKPYGDSDGMWIHPFTGEWM
jgi:hypothetical protein